MKALGLAMLLAATLPANPAAAGPLSDLLMAPGLLAEAPEGEVFRYVHHRRLPGQAPGSTPAGEGLDVAPLQAVADGRVILTNAADANGSQLQLMLGETDDMHVVATFPGRGPNPILLFFLENVVRTTVIQTGGSPYYIRNRIREAIAAAETGLDQDGKAVVVLRPFDSDPNRTRMGDFGALTLTLAYDFDDPARLLELLADTGSSTSGYTERLSLLTDE